MRFCQFAQSASLFASRSAIALKMKVRSRVKSERVISKSDVPSSVRKLHEIRALEVTKLKVGLVNQVLKGKNNEEAVKKRNTANR